jgi:hypothetical protein
MYKAYWLFLFIILFLILPLTATAQVTADDYSGCAGTTPGRVIQANPANYRDFLKSLQPGDLLQLAGGTYTKDLPLHEVSGAAGNCIIVEGPASGTPALFVNTDDCCNTVSLENSSYLIVRNLELDGRQGEADGVKAEGHADWTHHITIENLYIHDYDGDQLIVGISTKNPSWNWVIRGNRIESSGTGIYLGNSNGEDEFVNSLIEHNVIIDSTGYNMQIKRQDQRNLDLADGSMPANGRTIIRHNVFTKAHNAAVGDDGRPNLLVGHLPLSGPGSNDDYVIYGNFFFENQDGLEALFQGTGNIIFYNNVLYNSLGPGIAIFGHEGGDPQRVHIFQNTIVTKSEGIGISDADSSFQQLVSGNAVFAATPISGGQQTNNITDSFANAGSYLISPSGQLAGANRMDLFPKTNNSLSGTPADLSSINPYPDASRDFNSMPQDGSVRGAYAGQGANPGWKLAIEKKN